ncbi:hypothetical protein SAMN05421542_2070 [Chryseobacterium jejuense]|uniref:Uncharacterized protein n=1 Tax=Chryseobacterium jejuense TaxID=445960 RepID=A0A2X2XMG7_CHRJE|nr:hypothetical protein SAMN05421542_2070 [Chryseobacterium jejuense]SQB27570.1 Uncharacterised protein [Chryseobacterium jejuense]
MPWELFSMMQRVDWSKRWKMEAGGWKLMVDIKSIPPFNSINYNTTTFKLQASGTSPFQPPASLLQ